MDELDHLGWVVRHAYEAGGVRFGLRTNSPAFGEWLEDTFSGYRVDDEDIRPYYSVLVADESGDPHSKRYHILYEESRALVKTLDLGQVGEALVAQFEHVSARTRDDAIYVDAALVTYGDVVALVPPILPPYLATLGHRALDRSGVRFPLASYVAVGPGSGRVVPASPSVNVPDGALERLGDIAPPGPRNAQVETNGSVHVDVICFLGLAEELVVPSSPGSSLHLLGTRIINLDQTGGSGLQGVARLVDGAKCYEIQSSTPKTTLEGLVQALQPA